jgi:opacity protein-like surface antigen
MKKMLLAAGVALATISSAAYAAVTFDPETGAGWVGKGDVQTAFGWNNATMQSRHLGVTFGVDSTVSYDVTCEWETVTGGKNSKTITHNVTNHKNISSSAAVDSASRKTGQYTGWFLNGYEDGGLDDVDLPEVGDSCPQGGSASDNDPPENDAVVTAVSNVLGGGGTLTAYWGTDSRVIYTF